MALWSFNQRCSVVFKEACLDVVSLELVKPSVWNRTSSQPLSSCNKTFPLSASEHNNSDNTHMMLLINLKQSPLDVQNTVVFF